MPEHDVKTEIAGMIQDICERIPVTMEKLGDMVYRYVRDHKPELMTDAELFTSSLCRDALEAFHSAGPNIWKLYHKPEDGASIQ